MSLAEQSDDTDWSDRIHAVLKRHGEAEGDGHRMLAVCPPHLHGIRMGSRQGDQFFFEFDQSRQHDGPRRFL